jgi:hypothetical protein
MQPRTAGMPFDAARMSMRPFPNDKSGFDPLPAPVIEWLATIRKWQLDHQRMSAR